MTDDTILPFSLPAVSRKKVTAALLDRLTHHVHIVEMNGDSYRLAQSRAGKAIRSH